MAKGLLFAFILVVIFDNMTLIFAFHLTHRNPSIVFLYPSGIPFLYIIL